MRQEFVAKFDAAQQESNARFETLLRENRELQQQSNARFDTIQHQFNARTDRVFLSVLGIGVTLAGLGVAIAVRLWIAG